MIKLSKKNLYQNKKQTKAILISLILISVFLITVSVIFSSYKSYKVEKAILSGGEYHFRIENFDVNLVSNITNSIGVEEINIIPNVETKEYESYIYGNYSLSILDIEKYEKYVELNDGRYPKNSNELIISSEYAFMMKYEIGDVIDNYKIVGLYNKTKIHDESQTTDFAYSPQAYTEKAGIKVKEATILIKLDKLDNCYEKILNLASHLGLDYIHDSFGKIIFKNLIINNGLLNAYGHYENKNQQLQNDLYYIYVLLLICIFCFFVIFNIFNIAFSERKKLYSMLRSIGASKKQVYQLVQTEVIIATIISILLGFVLSIILSIISIKIINYLLIDFLEFSIHMTLSVKYLIISIIFVFLTTIFSSSLSAYRASKTPPIQGSIYTVTKKNIKYKNNKRIKMILGSICDLALKNIKRTKSKFTIIKISLIISVCMFICFTSVLNYFFEYNDNQKNSFDARVELFYKNGKSNTTILNNLKKIEFIDEIVYYKTATQYVMSSEFNETILMNFKMDEFEKATIVGLDDESYKNYTNSLGVKSSKVVIYNQKEMTGADGNNLYFDIYNVNKKNLVLFGERARIDINDEPIYEKMIELDNLFITNQNFNNMFNNVTIIVNIGTFDEWIDQYFVYYEGTMSASPINYRDMLEYQYNVNINAKKFKELDNEIDELKKKNSSNYIMYENYALNNYKEKQSKKTLKALLYIVIGALAFFSITGFVNTFNMCFNLRKKEFCMLRSMGMSNKKLSKMLSIEISYVISKALIIGYIISYFSLLLFKKITEIKITPNSTIVPFEIEYKYFVYALIFTIVCIYIIKCITINKIKKSNIVDSIREINT